MNSDPQTTSDIDRVRDASDIARVVGEHVDLAPKTREYVGLCPFHDDHKPSMYVVPSKQIYHCFVCGAGGDVFGFVQSYHKMTFGEALRYLAERAGVKLTERTRRRGPGDQPEAVGRSVLLDANEAAQRFFRSVLRHPEHGAAARDVIDRRGIAPDMAEAFGLGASPDRWDGLVLFAESKGLRLEALAKAGLVKARESGSGHYDALRNRLVFPIRDRIGRTIAFGARRLDEADEPKYLNSPETALFDKSATLYGLDQASRSIQRGGVAVIAEGYTDVIACHQAGFTNVVATLGTALTDKHAALLRQLCHTVVLLFDGDEAGQRAADRATEVFLSLPIDVRIATLEGRTTCKDPDELLKTEGGGNVLRAAIGEATELLAYRMHRLRRELEGAGPAAVEARLRQDLQQLGRLGLARADKVRWQFLLRRLHELTGLPPATIGELVRTSGARAEAHNPPREARGPRSPETEALACLIADPSLLTGLSDAERSLLLAACERAGHGPIMSALASLAAHDPRPTLARLLDELRERDEDAASAVALERDASTRLGHDPAALRATLATCLARLESGRVELTPLGTADRIAELKRLRTGAGAVDRTRLPRATPPGA